MSSLVLLNGDGTFCRKLELVYIPEDFEISQGKILSWREGIEQSSRFPDFSGPKPVFASFQFRNAGAQVDRVRVTDEDFSSQFGPPRFNVDRLRITVQGSVALDVMELRNLVMAFIQSEKGWEVSNNLNPKPK